MNYKMWKKALNVIPSVDKEEWSKLDIISKWLIASRAAVLIMTFLSGALAGIFALRDGAFSLIPWLALVIGLIFAHATNNLFNDYTDFIRGVDQDNYFRTMYGPQPVANGLITKKQLLIYTGVTGLIALVFGIYLLFYSRWDQIVLLCLGLGIFFVLFYTWPLKYIALGEIAVLIVWGPLMIGGGYYVLSHHWSWIVVLASLPYVFGVTTVIFGKHIDKIEMDRAKKIYTLPVILGEKTSRYLILSMMLTSYLLVVLMIFLRYFTPVMLVVLLALPQLKLILPAFLKPKPTTKPPDFPEGSGGWPLYFAPLAFVNNRSFGGYFLIGLVLDTILKILWPQIWG